MPDFLSSSNPGAYTNIGKISILYYAKTCCGLPSTTPPPNYLSTYQITVSQPGSSGSSSSLGGPLDETFKTTCLSYWCSSSSSSSSSSDSSDSSDSSSSGSSGSSSSSSSSGNFPLNKDTLDLLTKQFAIDYTNWKQYTFNYVFAGIAAVQPNGLTDVIEFSYLSERQGNFTIIYTYPLNFMFNNLAHYDYQNDCLFSTDTGLPNWDGQPYRYFYGPPGTCNGGLQLTRWGLIFADGRLQEKYISTDLFGSSSSSSSSFSQSSFSSESDDSSSDSSSSSPDDQMMMSRKIVTRSSLSSRSSSSLK